MSKTYDGQLFKIATHEGDKYVPGITLEKCPGLAVTMSGIGRFTITHIATGARLCNGNYERCDNAILEMTRLTAIAIAHKFSWEDKNPQEKIKSIANERVPFAAAITTDSDGRRPMTIQSYIEGLRPYIPWRDIDTPLWEETHPIDLAEDVLAGCVDDALHCE